MSAYLKSRVWAYIAVGLLLLVLVTSALMECWLMALFKKKGGGGRDT